MTDTQGPPPGAVPDLAAIRRSPSPDQLKTLIAAIPYADFLGIRINRAGNEMTAVLPYQDMLIGNPSLPALHGGVIGAFLETAAIVQLLGEIESEKMPKPVNISVEYLRSGRPMETYARAMVTKQGRRVANVRVEAWQDDRSRPIAALHGHFLIAPAGNPDAV